jgi:hypothetical protein
MNELSATEAKRGEHKYRKFVFSLRTHLYRFQRPKGTLRSSGDVAKVFNRTVESSRVKSGRVGSGQVGSLGRALESIVQPLHLHLLALANG